jgi:hypothetical protein
VTPISASVRRAVRERAGGRCEYCRIPELASPHAFHVEHIRSLKHGGSSNLDNLAWSCIFCNIHKGSDIAAYDDDTHSLTPLFDPRTQQWDDHFMLDGAKIVGQTPAGRVTITLLQLNHPNQAETRSALLDADLW